MGKFLLHCHKEFQTNLDGVVLRCPNLDCEHYQSVRNGSFFAKPSSTANSTFLQRIKDESKITLLPIGEENFLIQSPPNLSNSLVQHYVETINNHDLKLIMEKSPDPPSFPIPSEPIPTLDTKYIWTDGSKNDDGVGAGIFYSKESLVNKAVRLPPYFSSGEAEITAAIIAIQNS